MLAPAVRARHMKNILGAVAALDASIRARVESRLPGPLGSTVESAVPSVWLPVELNVELTDILSLELGAAATRAFFRRLVVSEYETNIFKSFIGTASRLLGLTPSTYVKLAPRGWEAVFKGCGTLTARERSAHQARLEYTNIPAACTRNELWLESVRSSFYSGFDLTRSNGAISWDELDLKRRRAVFLFTWS